jgi:hypothetical protein
MRTAVSRIKGELLSLEKPRLMAALQTRLQLIPSQLPAARRRGTVQFHLAVRHHRHAAVDRFNAKELNGIAKGIVPLKAASGLRNDLDQ